MITSQIFSKIFTKILALNTTQQRRRHNYKHVEQMTIVQCVNNEASGK